METRAFGAARLHVAVDDHHDAQARELAQVGVAERAVFAARHLLGHHAPRVRNDHPARDVLGLAGRKAEGHREILLRGGLRARDLLDGRVAQIARAAGAQPLLEVANAGAVADGDDVEPGIDRLDLGGVRRRHRAAAVGDTDAEAGRVEPAHTVAGPAVPLGDPHRLEIFAGPIEHGVRGEVLARLPQDRVAALIDAQLDLGHQRGLCIVRRDQRRPVSVAAPRAPIVHLAGDRRHRAFGDPLSELGPRRLAEAAVGVHDARVIFGRIGEQPGDAPVRQVRGVDLKGHRTPADVQHQLAHALGRRRARLARQRVIVEPIDLGVRPRHHAESRTSAR